MQPTPCVRAALAILLAGAMLTGARTDAIAQGSSRPGSDALTPRLEVLLRAMRIARDWHVARPGKAVLVSGAAQGLLHKLDPESDLYSRRDLERIGPVDHPPHVGLEVRREPAESRRASPGYRVVSARDDSPAALVGLKAGDLITHVGTKTAGEMSYLALLHLELTGSPGADVEIRVQRSGSERQETVRLPRGVGIGPSVVVDEPEAGVLRLRLSAIESRTADVAARAVGEASARLGPALRGLILDVRATAGGDVEEAAAVADALLDDGIVLTREARKPQPPQTTAAAPGDVLGGRPIVALVDAGTAGPAEALVAALRDNRRSHVAGERTAGRGALRTLRPLGKRGEKGAIRIVTARLLTPTGKPIDRDGLTPDETVAQVPADHGCRSLDITEADRPGFCRRRTLAEDTQLRRAIARLGEDVAVSGPVPREMTPPSRRPAMARP
jgi:carboxyl-terminal processing protease